MLNMPTMPMNGSMVTEKPVARKVTDIGLVAFLYALGERPVRITGRTGPQIRREFYFVVPEALVFDYYQGRTRVEPRVLFAAMRDVKALAIQEL
jgi:hypothetical protein